MEDCPLCCAYSVVCVESRGDKNRSMDEISVASKDQGLFKGLEAILYISVPIKLPILGQVQATEP
jgi:hypothetical protein